MKMLFKILFLIFTINLLSINVADAVLTNSAPQNYQQKPKQKPVSYTQNSRNTNNYSNNDNTDFRPYMENVQRRIKNNWYPPKNTESTRVTVLFKIDKFGRLLDAKIISSSGDAEAERAAIDALYRTAPFDPLPSSYSGSSVDIQFNFDYNVYNNNY